MRLKSTLALLASLAFLFPGIAYAHPGHDQGASMIQGMAHPFSGFDHILAMVMVGLFAVQLGGRSLWVLPATFMAAMAAGSLIGLGGAQAATVELAISLSILMLGIVIAVQRRWSLGAAMALVGILALFHGHAHGLEAAGGMSASYLAGFLVSTAILHVSGVVAGLGFYGLGKGEAGGIVARGFGVAGAVAGLAMIAA